MDAVKKARNYLIIVKGAPGMFAQTREAMMNLVTTAVYILVDNFIVVEFWKKHLGTQGCAYKTFDEPLTNEWVTALIDDALALTYLPE